MVSNARVVKTSVVFLLLGLIAPGCSRTPSLPNLNLPRFEENFPQIDSVWLAQKLLQSQADGVFVLCADGTLRTQQLGCSPTPAVAPKPSDQLSYKWYREMDYRNPAKIAQLGTVLFLVEPGCKAGVFLDMFEICHAIGTTQDTYLVEWNQDFMIAQRTRLNGSHARNYPEYGIFLQVQTAESSSGAWHYRWGNPMGAFDGVLPYNQGPTEEPYPWTEVETLSKLITQLKSRFELDKTIHLRMDRNQLVADVLQLVESFHLAGFQYVQIN